MKLKIYQRKADKKSEKSLIRHRGDIPAILYSKDKQNQSITIVGKDFEGFLRTLKQGHLPTSIFTLEGEGIACKVIVKDIQYEPTTYKVLHLDLLELDETQPIKVSVPVSFTGMTECSGIKLGGFLRQVIRHVKVKCLPKNLPPEFVLDVRDLGLKQSKRVSDIVIPPGVTPLAPLNEVVVVIAKK